MNENDETLEFHCDGCERSFKTLQALTAHRRVHRRDVNNIDRFVNEDGMADAILHNHPTTQSVLRDDNTTETLADTLLEKSSSATIIKIKRLPHGEGLPDMKRATSGSAAVDVYAANDEPICIGSRERNTIPLGFAIEVPEGFVAKVVPRSGLAFNSGMTLMNTPGIIDADYRGEVKACLVNHSRSKFWVHRGDRIGQMLFEKVEPVQIQYVEELSLTERGTGGFGSTGSK